MQGKVLVSLCSSSLKIPCYLPKECKVCGINRKSHSIPANLDVNRRRNSLFFMRETGITWKSCRKHFFKKNSTFKVSIFNFSDMQILDLCLFRYFNFEDKAKSYICLQTFDVLPLPWSERREQIEEWICKEAPSGLRRVAVLH